MKKYTWIASSNDGSYEASSCRFFDTKKEAYEDMRNEALEKMKWNTELSDFSDMDESDWIGYNVKFHPNYIVHESYSGIYTYEIVEKRDKVHKHDRDWEIIDIFAPREMYDWLIATFDGVGEMWMNNHDGYMVLIEPSGRILKSDI
jgi:hypothetical protein